MNIPSVEGVCGAVRMTKSAWEASLLTRQDDAIIHALRRLIYARIDADHAHSEMLTVQSRCAANSPTPIISAVDSAKCVAGRISPPLRQ